MKQTIFIYLLPWEQCHDLFPGCVARWHCFDTDRGLIAEIWEDDHGTYRVDMVPELADTTFTTLQEVQEATDRILAGWEGIILLDEERARKLRLLI